MIYFLRPFLFCLLSTFALVAETISPSVLYLTWLHDPTSTMTIQWHTDPEQTHSFISFRKEGEAAWKEAYGISQRIYKSDFLVHTVDLQGLDSDSTYEFKIHDDHPDQESDADRGSFYRFATMPENLTRPVRFIIGGDAYHSLERFRKMNAAIAKLSPDFVVVGGDIAYTNGAKHFFKTRGWQLKRWQKFIKEWNAHVVAEDGRLIPFMPVLGNHDIRGVSPTLKGQHHLFYELFALPQKGIPYRELTFGDYMSLYLLDSGHNFHIEGQQTEWLERTMKKFQDIPYKFAVYHVSAYPSVYPFNGDTPVKIRENWCPLFDRYHLTAAFENHNHAYKRTYPLTQNALDSQGVIYMGDGSWGVTPRKPKKAWYLEKTASVNAVSLITLKRESALIESFNSSGVVFDSVSIPRQPIRK